VADWNTTDAYRTVQVFGPGTVADVMDIGFVIHPSETYGRVQVEISQWTDGTYESILDRMATGVERALGYAEVAAISFEQDVAPSGLLKDVFVVTVQAQPSQPGQFGPFYGEVRIPSYAFSTGQGTDTLVNNPIAAELARLQHLTQL
jgi:hypothetical protein